MIVYYIGKLKTNTDCEILQKDLDTLQKWESKWKMKFHPGKCQVLKISRKRSKIHDDHIIHNQTIKETSYAKYLGITIDNKLRWHKQTQIVRQKANNTIGIS